MYQLSVGNLASAHLIILSAVFGRTLAITKQAVKMTSSTITPKGNQSSLSLHMSSPNPRHNNLVNRSADALRLRPTFLPRPITQGVIHQLSPPTYPPISPSSLSATAFALPGYISPSRSPFRAQESRQSARPNSPFLQGAWQPSCANRGA